MCVTTKITEKYDEYIDQIHSLKTHHCIMMGKTAIKWTELHNIHARISICCKDLLGLYFIGRKHYCHRSFTCEQE